MGWVNEREEANVWVMIERPYVVNYGRAFVPTGGRARYIYGMDQLQEATRELTDPRKLQILYVIDGALSYSPEQAQLAADHLGRLEIPRQNIVVAHRAGASSRFSSICATITSLDKL